MIPIIVFDLDDTLYSEITFVHSGFRAVAYFLESQFGIPEKDSFELMVEEEKESRNKVFNRCLEKLNINNKKNIEKCISVYRNHIPNIKLDSEAEECLKNLHEFPKYIVTDGNKLVQYNKIKALNLETMVKKVFITHRYKTTNAKPSPYCFLKICQLENSEPQNLVYIGDNPNKDFVGIKPLGFKTIRILKGNYKNINKPKEFEADFNINSLSEIDLCFLKNVFNK